jgi:hypothetical protein
MTDEPVRRAPASPPVVRGRRYKRHALELADGTRLVLEADGTIEHLAADGSRTRSWMPDDPEWSGQAIRFGLRPQAQTVAPHGRVPGARPHQG